MNTSRRGIFSLLAVAALPAAAMVSEPVQAKTQPKFPKGQIIPRVRSYVVNDGMAHTHSFSTSPSNAGHTHSFAGAGSARAANETYYEIYDGSKFVLLESEAGQRVIAELTG